MTTFFLHGYGSSARRFRKTISTSGYKLPADHVFAEGLEEDNLFGGRRWFPLSQDDRKIRTWLGDAAEHVESIIVGSAVAGAHTELVGHSQGGMLALEIVSRGRVNIDRVVAYAAYLPDPNDGVVDRRFICPEINLLSSLGDKYICHEKVSDSHSFFIRRSFPKVRHFVAENIPHEFSNIWLDRGRFRKCQYA